MFYGPELQPFVTIGRGDCGGLRDTPHFIQCGKGCGDIVRLLLAVLRETDKFQAVPATTFPEWPRLHKCRLHPVRGHDNVRERKQPPPTAEPLGSLVEPETMLAQNRAHHSGRKTNENQAGNGTEGQDQLREQTNAVDLVHAHTALFGQTDPMFDVPKIERQQEIKLLRKTTEHRENHE